MNSHLIIKKYFNQIAEIFNNNISEPNCEVLPFQKPNHEWLNYFYTSPIFRHVHLEYYKTEKICALHSTILPAPLVDFPIYGFDMIALGDKITGLFFDFTPTGSDYEDLKSFLINFKNRIQSPQRPLPDWGTIFSENFICVSPKEDELNDIFNTVELGTRAYLANSFPVKEFYLKNVEKQNAYCQGQKKNEKTFKALTAEIGEDNSLLFFNDYLFPEIK